MTNFYKLNYLFSHDRKSKGLRGFSVTRFDYNGA